MLGNMVRVVLTDAEIFEGMMVQQNSAGVTVHNTTGLNDIRKFIPYQMIYEIVDKGRAP